MTRRQALAAFVARARNGARPLELTRRARLVAREWSSVAYAHTLELGGKASRELFVTDVMGRNLSTFPP
jgi:hypothetical protein